MLLLAAFSAHADTKSEALLKEMSSRLSGYKNYKVEMTVLYDGATGLDRAVLIAEGDKFFLDLPDAEISCDGKAVYTYNKEDNEVIIENNADAGSVLTNPAKLFAFDSKEFVSASAGERTVGGKKYDIIELKPVRGPMAYKLVVMLGEDRLPSSIVIRPEGESDISLQVVRLTPNVATDKNTFVFDKKKHPGVEVSDFR